MKKYLKYLSFLAIILCFSISKVYAYDTLTIDYETYDHTSNENFYNEMKTYIDNNNTYNRNYILARDNNYYGYEVIIMQPFSGYTSCYEISKLYASVFYQNYDSTDNILATYIFFYGNTNDINNCIGTRRMYYISANDYNAKGNTYNTFIENIRNVLNRETYSYWGDNFNGIEYMFNKNTFPGPNIPSVVGEIGYSTLPIKYIDNYYVNGESANRTNKTEQQICNEKTIITDAYDTEVEYKGNILNCGDNYPTYIDYTNDIPTYIEQYDINYTKEIKSIDIYHTLPNIQKEKWKIEIENDEIITPTYTIYGKKCENTTCYWENANNGYISNTNTEKTNNITTITFEEQETIGTYTTYKIAIEINTEEESNIKIYNIENTNINVDINTIGKEYNIESYIVTTNTGILVNGKNNNLNYRTYTKRDTPFKDITYYQYHKSSNLVKEDLQSNIFKIGLTTTNRILYGSEKLTTYYYIQTTNLEIGANSDNSLYILLLPFENSNNIYYVYYNTEVYYTKSNNLTFTIDYNNTQTTKTVNVDNGYITNNYNNITNINLSDIERIVLEYEQYKNDWIELWESIYNPLPNIIKHIMIILYTGALTYGIFLIWKD